jgi:hypothetical protein
MIFNKFKHVYMSPETGGEEGSGGGLAPVVEPTDNPEVIEGQQTDEKPTEKPAAEKEQSTEPEDTTLPEKEVSNSKIGKVTGLVEKAGLDMKEIAEYAKANDGEVDLDTLVALKEKHGEEVASLIADQIKGIHTERTEAATKRDAEVYDQVKDSLKDVSSDPEQSGEDMWKELATWSKDNVSNEHRTEINKLLSQGGLAAKLAVQELTTVFKESLGTQEFQEAELLGGDELTSTNSKNISKNEYNMELNKLTNAGHQYGQSREIASLDARRMKSIQRGFN